jgi:arylsulfatase A
MPLEAQNPAETTIARMLKNQGYATACIGKWHLGHLKEFLPTNQGFDSYYGIPYSNDMGIDKDMALADNVVWRQGIDEEKFRKGNGGGPPLMRGTEGAAVASRPPTDPYVKDCLIRLLP